MDAYVIQRTDAGPPLCHSLIPDQPNRMGRGLDCQVVLTDPLSSRVHAIISCEDDIWWLRDADSRNGTYVNEQKVDEAQLADGCAIRIGSVEFSFHVGAAPMLGPDRPGVTQTLVLDTPVSETDATSNYAVAALRDPERAQDLLDLHQLSVRLLGCNDPDEVVRFSLDLLRQRVQASVLGFLWANDEGDLRPKLVFPESAAGDVILSQSLTELVLEKGHAVWVNSQTSDSPAESLSHFADAVCVPLIRDGDLLGALHVYLEQGRFGQSDFDMVTSVATILVVALTKARQIATLKADHERLVLQSAAFDELIGDSSPMQSLKDRILRIARASGCVLVRGESGSGKELVARAIHRASSRADRPMLSVNCAALPRDLMESQLFGHKKGAFTGADTDHVGWFQQADLGTLFLDEVGELTLEGQAKLLRILEGHPFLPVGSHKEISVDVRVIAATNRDLRELLPEGKFREDLYYRLGVFELAVPPLRDRGDDVRRLMRFFLDHFKLQHGRPELDLSSEAEKQLLAYSWPGNVRQLRNVIDSAVVLADGDKIEADDLGLRDATGEALESLRFEFWERKLIREALTRTAGNIPAAAKLLGIGRATLYRKIDQYDISRGDS
jgi:Nif-specific regulatory protein